jgi:hypothetical protein
MGRTPPNQPPNQAPNCLRCRHFYVTWDLQFPRGCSVFGIKSRHMPSLVVYRATGYHCPSFEPSPAGRRHQR